MKKSLEDACINLKDLKYHNRFPIKIIYLIACFLIQFNLLFSYCAMIGLDINDVDVPNGNWIVLANGSWNEWSWGVQLNDYDNDSIYQGNLCDLNPGEYQYVYTITGDFDNWSGWGLVGNAPIGSSCDYDPGDQWLNYGFNIQNQDILTEFNAWGECGLGDEIGQNNLLLKPLNGDILNYIQVPFEWQQLPYAIGYNIQISLSEDFNDLIVDHFEATTLYLDINNLNWDTSYYWKLRPYYNDGNYGDWTDINYFSIGLSQFDLESNIYNEEDIIYPYTLFGDWNNYRSSILDINGKEIWNSGSFGFMMNHVSNYGQLFGCSMLNHPNNMGIEINYDEEVVWSSQSWVDQHEFKQIPNGNYMGFQSAWENGPIPLGGWTNTFQQLGYQADGITNEFPYYASKLIEFDSITGNEIWSWNPHEYYDKQDTDLFGGTWWQSIGNLNHDWTHSNAFYFDSSESSIFISDRHLSRITKIDYPSGNIVWMMGLPEEYMSSGDQHICSDLEFSFQHNIQKLENGDLLFFDNGNLDQTVFQNGTNTSRAIRVEVVDNSYCNVVWEYELPSHLFGAGMGSVQALENGNYFINTTGSGGTLLEVNAQGDLLWEINLNLSWPSGSGYRAYRVPSIHPGIFSIEVDNYIQFESDSLINVIELTNLNNFIEFNITNRSGYSLPFVYQLSSVLGDSFEEIEDLINIPVYSDQNLIFYPIYPIEFMQKIELKIWPKHHPYLEKTLLFNVIYNEINTDLGDINSDGAIDIIDIIIIMDFIIYEEEMNENQLYIADLNGDLIVNVIDIIILVEYILNY